MLRLKPPHTECQAALDLHAIAASCCGDSACVSASRCRDIGSYSECMHALAATVQMHKSFGTAPYQAGSCEAASLRGEGKGSRQGPANLIGHSANELSLQLPLQLTGAHC